MDARGLQPLGCSFAAIALLALLCASDATAAVHGTKVKYCTRHSHPRGCVTVPKSVKRPARVDQQGSDALTPPDVANGGGLGGGPGNHRAAALEWARTQRGLGQWAWRCERFVEEAYGTRQRFDTAAAAARSHDLQLHREPITAAPAGTLVYFAADRYNQGYGHVGLSLGNGKMISALTTVTTTDVAHSPYWRHLYLGWADAPDSWPGRIPPPPGPTMTDPTVSVRLTAPAFGQTIAGTVALIATTSGPVGGVALDAYYADNPLNPLTANWHALGTATRQDDSWALEWNTQAVPNQGTVNVAAIALNASGQRTGTRDYRRLSVDNTAAVAPPPIVPAHVYHVHNTCRDNACGLVVETGGPGARFGGTIVGSIADGTAVDIRCQTVGGVVVGGDGTNDVWDQIEWAGGVAYVPDLYIDTPGDDHSQANRYFTSSIPRCT